MGGFHTSDRIKEIIEQYETERPYGDVGEVLEQCLVLTRWLEQGKLLSEHIQLGS